MTSKILGHCAGVISIWEVLSCCVFNMMIMERKILLIKKYHFPQGMVLVILGNGPRILVRVCPPPDKSSGISRKLKETMTALRDLQ